MTPRRNPENTQFNLQCQLSSRVFSLKELSHCFQYVDLIRDVLT